VHHHHQMMIVTELDIIINLAKDAQLLPIVDSTALGYYHHIILQKAPFYYPMHYCCCYLRFSDLRVAKKRFGESYQYSSGFDPFSVACLLTVLQ
jgi:hypothetical protein